MKLFLAAAATTILLTTTACATTADTTSPTNTATPATPTAPETTSPSASPAGGAYCDPLEAALEVFNASPPEGADPEVVLAEQVKEAQTLYQQAADEMRTAGLADAADYVIALIEYQTLLTSGADENSTDVTTAETKLQNLMATAEPQLTTVETNCGLGEQPADQ